MARLARFTKSSLTLLVIAGCSDGAVAPEDTNHAPSFVSWPALDVFHDQQYNYDIVVADEDGDPVTVTASRYPTWLTFDSTALSLSGIPGVDNIGSHPVRLTASDSTTSTPLEFTIVVAPNLGSLQWEGSWSAAGLAFGHDGHPYRSDNFVVYSGFSITRERQYVAEELEDCFVELQAALNVTAGDFQYPGTGTDIDVLTLRYQGNDVLWTGQSYRYGLVVHAPDSPRYVQEGYTRSLYRQLLKHELTHVTEYLLIGTAGDYTATEKWLHEGIATYLAGTPPNRIMFSHQVSAWQTAMSNFPGGGNPISIETWADFPEQFANDAQVLGQYYLLFDLAVRYLVDPNGLGRSVEDIKSIYLDIRNGDSFVVAFENRMGLSVDEYEATFFNLVMEYLK
jgi:hypothetical protein